MGLIKYEEHTLFICEPVAMEVLSNATSATYEYYQSNIKPKPEADFEKIEQR